MVKPKIARREWLWKKHWWILVRAGTQSIIMPIWWKKCTSIRRRTQGECWRVIILTESAATYSNRITIYMLKLRPSLFLVNKDIENIETTIPIRLMYTMTTLLSKSIQDKFLHLEHNSRKRIIWKVYGILLLSKIWKNKGRRRAWRGCRSSRPKSNLSTLWSSS